VFCAVQSFYIQQILFSLSTFRVRDAARLYHSREPEVVHWSGIKAGLLSTHHGEFSKLFCSKTDREVDIFNQSGARCGEQLFNMIDMCTAFSSGKDQSCPVFRSLINVDPSNLGKLRKALDDLQRAAQMTRISRNKVAHNLLSASQKDLDQLVLHVRQLLENILIVASCVAEPFLFDDAQSALDEIDGCYKRDIRIGTINAEDHQKVRQYHDQLLQLLEEHDELVVEHGRLQEETQFLKEKHGRKFDLVARCLKSHIQEQLIEGKPALFALSFLEI
jgi:hypothetical protein